MESTSTTSTEYLLCPVCGVALRAITTQHIKKHGYADAMSFKEAHGLEFLQCPAQRQRHAQFMHESNPTSEGHRPESILKMREARKGKGVGKAGKYTRTSEIRDRIAQGVIRSWETGNRGKGTHVYSRKLERKVWIRSSWEERVIHILDRHPCVESYDVEPLSIPYFWDGCAHRYVPDFLVLLEGGIRELWEIKPEELIAHPRNVAKIQALNVYLTQQGMNGRVVTLSQIEEMERQVGIKPWLGNGAPWVRLNDPDYRPRIAELRSSGHTPE